MKKIDSDKKINNNSYNSKYRNVIYCVILSTILAAYITG